MPNTGPAFAIAWFSTLKYAARPFGSGTILQRSLHAQRQSSRERTLRVRSAAFQAHLRKGRRPGRNAQARVLRKADPGAQAQGRRGRQASPAPRVARRDQAPAVVLIARGRLRAGRLWAILRPAWRGL